MISTCIYAYLSRRESDGEFLRTDGAVTPRKLANFTFRRVLLPH